MKYQPVSDNFDPAHKKGVRFKNILNSIFLITLLLNYISYIFAPENSMFDIESIIYLLILGCCMMLTVIAANRLSFPILLVLIIYTYQRYLLSGFTMIFSGGGSSNIFDSYSGYTAAEYNVCLRYAILGYLAVAMGFILGVSDTPKKVRIFGMGDLLKDSSTKRLSAWMILFYFLVISSITLYNYYFQGSRYVGPKADDEGSPLRIFLNGNIVIILVITILLFRSEFISKRNRMILYGIMFFSLLLSIQGGSRSYLYNIFINYIVIFLVLRDGNYRVNFNWKIITGILLAAIVIYPLATIMRYKDVLDDTGIEGADRFSQANEYFYGSSGNQGILILMSIFQRLNSFETSLMIMNDRNVMPYDFLLSIPSVIGRLINNFLPGEPIPNLLLPQSLFDHIYFNRFVGWNAYDWGLWEQFYLIFGYWGGVIALFVFMLPIGYLWRRLLLSQSPFKLFYIGTFVYFFLQRLLVNYEVSLVISSLLMQIVVFHILYFVLTKLNSFLRLKPMESKQ